MNKINHNEKTEQDFLMVEKNNNSKKKKKKYILKKMATTKWKEPSFLREKITRLIFQIWFPAN